MPQFITADPEVQIADNAARIVLALRLLKEHRRCPEAEEAGSLLAGILHRERITILPADISDIYGLWRNADREEWHDAAFAIGAVYQILALQN